MKTANSETQPDETLLRVTYIKPFENIALAFSGGGFRAASFALGVLSYLHKLEFDDDDDALKGATLLQQVSYMSSASGGTIATSLYALYSAGGKTFGQFYAKLFEILTGEKLLENALSILANKKRWQKDSLKSRNIINAFAQAYDEYIFEGQTLNDLRNDIQGRSHLQEVCFNTTEFYTGLSFRQDIKLVPDPKPDPYYKFGNENIFIDHHIAKKIRLGDVLAASSCFPGGFEPIMFPDDFTYKGLSCEELKNALTLKPQTGDKEETEFIAKKYIGFMDGGITDNQGLQSMMYADGRRIRRETTFSPFSLMLVNDVGSYFITPYIMPAQPENKGITLTGMYWITAALFLLGTAGAVWGIYANQPTIAFIGGVILILPLLFLLLVSWLGRQVKGLSGKSSPLDLNAIFTEHIIRLIIHYFTKTPIAVLKQMLEARAQSVLMLNMDVFMKRIRQLIYNRFYGSSEWKNRGKGNHIYDLAFVSDIYRQQNPPPSPFLNPSRDIQIVAQTAYNMGTTLWFDKSAVNQQHSQACIIASGQFTTCYNLLGYIEKLLLVPSAYDASYQGRLMALKKQLEADYTRYKTDPFFLYNDFGKQWIAQFKPVSMKDIPDPGY